MKHRVFMDTAFLIAVLDESDKYHHVAVDTYKKLINEEWEIITTDAILIEIGNGLSKRRWPRTLGNRGARRSPDRFLPSYLIFSFATVNTGVYPHIARDSGISLSPNCC